jgi:hypothetical protein
MFARAITRVLDRRNITERELAILLGAPTVLLEVPGTGGMPA